MVDCPPKHNHLLTRQKKKKKKRTFIALSFKIMTLWKDRLLSKPNFTIENVLYVTGDVEVRKRKVWEIELA